MRGFSTRILALDLARPASPIIVVDNLPGTPDNLNRTADGRLLLAYYDRVAVLERWVLPYGISRQVFARLPVSLFVNEEEPLSGGILSFDASGRMMTVSPGIVPAPTTVVEHESRWYLGALLSQPVRYVQGEARQ